MTRRSVSRGPGVTHRPPGSYTPPNPPVQLSTFYGINGHFTWNWAPNATPYTQPYWGAATNAMKDLNMGIYRNGYSCSYDSNANLTSSDGGTFQTFINSYASPNGIQVYPVCLVPFSSVYPSGQSATETTAYNVGFQFGVDVATHLKGLVPWYEIGNEVDSYAIISGSYRGTATTDYDNTKFQLARGGFRGIIAGIKSIDTSTPIMMAGGTWMHTAFFDMLLAGTQPDGTTGHPTITWDLTSWHWYTNNYPPNDDIEVLSGQGGYNVLAHLAGWGKPIYMTECGAVWSAYSDSETAIETALTAANYLVDRFVSVRNTYNIKGVFPYQLFDAAAPGTPSTDNEMNYGFIANDGSTKKGRYTTVKSYIASNPL